MTDFAEQGPAVPITPPEIETISQAAEEMQRIYGVLGEKAVVLTNEFYMDAIRNGREDEDWRYTPGLLSFKVPILGPVVRRANELLLGARYNGFNNLDHLYALATGVARTWRGAPLLNALTIDRTGMGFAPDEQYLVSDGQIWRGQHSYPRDLRPTSASIGEQRSTPVGFLTGKHEPLTEVDDTLFKTINELRAYEELDPANYRQ